MPLISLQEIHDHVDACLNAVPDRLAPELDSASAASSNSKPLRPLSALQIPQVPKCEAIAGSSKCFIKQEGEVNIFTTLMTSYKENEAWKEASTVEDRDFRATKANGGRRKAPFYKVMQGMPIAVDAFRYGAIPNVIAYFLTHAHSDHYTNLSTKWDIGPIYCSEPTANLIIHMLGVDPKWVHPLPMDVPTTIPNTGGVQVTLIEANHCPGSCLFLFEGRQTVNAGDSAYKSQFVGSAKVFRYLHCGDFRASPQHALHPAVKDKHIDHCYLDTTYLDPKYCFPPQPLVISACAELAKRLVLGRSSDDATAGDGKPRTMTGWFTRVEKSDKGKEKEKANASDKILVVVGTYSIGKERIVKAIAKALDTKVYCDSRKAAILRCQSDPDLHALLTTDPLAAGVHLVPLALIASDRLKAYMERWKGHYSKAIGFRPTGWTFSAPSGTDMLPSIPTVISRSQSRTFTHANLQPARNSTAAVQVYGVPYSEHSSFFELTCFALSFDWTRMIATVNVGSETSRGKMARWVERWEAERKKRGKVEVVGYRAQDYW
ncbi:DRMBL-domain-containing protein [Ganoderma leucocontextum]|nr:DRMBL-domain-containing protein [Ganoderma leucocontextum]